MSFLGQERIEYKISFLFVTLTFLAVLVYPLITILGQSFYRNGELTLINYTNILGNESFWQTLLNSLTVSGLAALISAILAFFCAYGLHFTRLPQGLKTLVPIIVLLPLFLPSITYGFAVIYSFGRFGLVSQLIGAPPFSIYGFWGLLIANVIYTLPPAFLILNNAFLYVDKHFITVSKVMGDGMLRTFYMTALRPVIGAIAAAFILSFFLCFTDFGIPASIAGQYNVISIELYNTMMGAVPDFAGGAVIAVTMLIPAMISVILLRATERFNFRYNRISDIELSRNTLRDIVFCLYYLAITFVLFAVFAVMFVVPFVKSWPYQIEFTLDTVQRLLSDSAIGAVYVNSLFVALVSAGIGTLFCYIAGMINARSKLNRWCQTTMDILAMVTNTVPGMVIGVGFLFAFSGTALMNTFAILVAANLVHFFTTPYLMSQAALSKMNASWESTGALMGDTWIQTVTRIVIPNSLSTLIHMFGYLFINAMVTISAIVFLTGAKTMVLTTKIKELQYFEKFDEIFVLSLLIFLTNIVVKLSLDRLSKHYRNKNRMPFSAHFKRFFSLTKKGFIQ